MSMTVFGVYNSLILSILLSQNIPGLHRVQSPLSFRIGSHVSGLTLIIDIGYMLGISLDTKPIAPNVLSVFAIKLITDD